MLGDGCDQHCVASHPFVRSARLPKTPEKGPGAAPSAPRTLPSICGCRPSADLGSPPPAQGIPFGTLSRVSVCSCSLAAEYLPRLKSERRGEEMTGTDDTERGLISADTRLRAVLTSWYQSRRYRPGTPPRPSTQTDMNREFENSRNASWQWFLVALFLFTTIDYFYLRSN